MSLPRIVRDEVLDDLPADDPRARRSRRDLARVHLAMGTRGILRRALGPLFAAVREASAAAGRGPGASGDDVPLSVLEIGAGDGTLLLGAARGSPGGAAAGAAGAGVVHLTLLDRLDLVAPATRDAYAARGWHADVLIADVLDRDAWKAVGDRRWDVIVANLFVHHFEGEALDRLLGTVASRCTAFLACEPRRARLALAGSHLVGLLGANDVTRTDAVLSVHAGFRDHELGERWPAPERWRIEERSAGLFTHVFSARRSGAEARAGTPPR